MENLTLLTDFYELTMMQGYFKNKTNPTVVFDMFYRVNPNDGGYAICCGLEQIIDYIKELRFTYEDIDYLRSLDIFDEEFLNYLAGFHFIVCFVLHQIPLPKGRFSLVQTETMQKRPPSGGRFFGLFFRFHVSFK